VDLSGAIFGIVFLSPFFALTALAIKWDSPGPVLVKLKRVSHGKEFNLYKFRSMVNGAEDLKKFLWAYNERDDGPLFKIKKDPRVTSVGRFLRKYRIDEFPQLINVLKGEMSLVGPRPHQPDEIAQYQKHHKKVLAIKAGMSGFAQISGSSDLSFEEEVKLDTYYIEKWSLLMDIKILLKTIVVLVRDRSAC
ncbi:sugar transferase, partial [Patescibacteria group bacterium]|nr:sugar transferase [Patescibacteria group bacterium]